MSVTIAQFPFVLSAANNGLGFPQGGQFVRCITADEDFLISIDGAPPVPIGQGRAIASKNPDGTPKHFTILEFTRSATAAVANNSIVLVTGDIDYIDNRLAVTAALSIAAGQTIRQTPAATLSGANADVVLVAATNAVVVAANASRRCVRITNTGVVAARLATDPADLTAGRGEIIQPGETRELWVTGAISARSAGTPTLVVGEEVF